MKKFNQFEENLIENIEQEIKRVKAPILINQIKARYLNEVKTAPKTKQRWSLTLKLASSFVTLFLLGFFAINLINNPTIIDEPFVNVKIPNANEQIEVVAFEAVSGVNLIETVGTEIITSSRLLSKAQSNFNDQLSIINKHMVIIEQLLYPNKNLTVNMLAPSSEYKNRMTVVTSNIFGEKYEYFIKYNETIEDEEVEDDLTEKETIIEGKLIIGEDIFELSGEKKIETDSNGKIVSIDVELKIYLDQDNWVQISQEKEDNKQKYVYNTCVNNKQSQTKIKVDYNKNKGLSADLEINDKGLGNSKYSFKQIKINNQVGIEMKGNQNFIVNIFLETDPIDNQNLYRYQIGNQESKLLKKEIRGQMKKNYK